MKDRSRMQSLAIASELGEPRAPALELVDLFDPIPQIVRCEVELEAAPVGDEGCRHSSQVKGSLRVV